MRDTITSKVKSATQVIKLAALAALRVVATAVASATGPQSRTHVIGFGPIEVPPYTTVTVQNQPQVMFKGERIINTGDEDDLSIMGLYIGNKTQLPTFSNSIALKCYRIDSGITHSDFDTCNPAFYITFQIQNTGDKPRKFSAVIAGKCVF